MGFSLVPDYRFNKFSDITPDFLLSIGVKGVILDIDNTLEPYENAEPTESVRVWLSALANAGIKCAFVSNNDKGRVERFNRDLSLPSFPKSKKPFKKNLVKAMAVMGTNTNNTVSVGDQIFTDVWAAKNARIRAIILPPIKDKRDMLTRFKRLLERPILKKFEKRNKI